MRWLSMVLILVVAFGAAGCASKFKNYYGPKVTHVVVYKEQRKMHLLHHNTVLKSYDIDLGFAPEGHKQFEGDGRTPEGQYWIDRRNPNSAFYLSIGISYPNADDRAYAKSQGKSPGGDIFIHGQPELFKAGKDDWTAGCISVTNREMRDIYAMVKNGTQVWIYP
ncbi:L,D-transpeptidase-like protein [Shimia isoporae]|uniref:L,D-transpeptidase-like protein n=1 Tax=Shimia isoporae TaxID=647720 RepID=A0A4R1N8L5_9RHOB|nr:L,D-transpeptidase family protein [Shimia isoporae]TCK99890.1 L,D-transpeptidase-like protein [Shimia isoporae]